MLTLITGLPGNGKTLFALDYIAAKAKKESREVYYHGIAQLAIDGWTEFKADEWHDLPDGCIVVIDEAQFVFERKPNGAQLPQHYQKLAVHRHQGKDLFVITQHPTLLDNFVRKLVGQHFHVVRKFGLERATVYEWSNANPAPENTASKKSAIAIKYKYNKQVYSWYKSAEVHTVKKKIPWQFFAVGLMVVGVCYAMYWFVERYRARGEEMKPAVLAPAGESSSGGGGTGAPVDPIQDLKDYAWRRTPRVVGLPHTAPIYDKLTEPTRVPIPAMCIQVGAPRPGKPLVCRCFTQQGTPMDVETNMCVDFARNGFFRDFDPDRQAQEARRSDTERDHYRSDASASMLAERYPDRPIRENYGAPQVLAFADVEPSGGQGIRPAPNLNDGPPKEQRVREALVP